MTEKEWSDYVRNGQAFAGEDGELAAVGFIPHTQIFNPVGSGVRVRVRALVSDAFGGVNSNMARHDVALTTFAPIFPPLNLLGSGGAAPVAELRKESPAVTLGTAFWLFLASGPVERNYPGRQQSWGYDLLPGQGLLVFSGTSLLIVTGYMWAEVPL